MRTDQFRFGTPRKQSNHKALLRFALRNNAPDHVIECIMVDTAVSSRVYNCDWDRVTESN